MSKQTFLNELVANGYQPRDLEGLPTEDLALLVQEEYVANVWSAEARAAAMVARKRSGKLWGSARREIATKVRSVRALGGGRKQQQKAYKNAVGTEYRKHSKYVKTQLTEGALVKLSSRLGMKGSHTITSIYKSSSGSKYYNVSKKGKHAGIVHESDITHVRM